MVSFTHVVISQIVDTHRAIVKEVGVTCPNCHQGQIIERKTKRNRIFYGCNRYPECEFTSWDKPVGRDCPKCGHFLMEKKIRGGGKQIVCSNGDYEEEKIKIKIIRVEMIISALFNLNLTDFIFLCLTRRRLFLLRSRYAHYLS